MGYENTIAANKRRATHGMSGTPTHQVWRSMRDRCNNPNNSRFADYGGRGIDICPEWDDFAVFFRDMGERPERHSLDRIDNNRGYYPDNCRWAARVEQQNNMRTNRLVEYDGQKLTMAEWSRKFDIPYHVVRYRLNKGMRLEEVFDPEVRATKDKTIFVDYEGDYISLKEASKKSGISYSTLWYRHMRNIPLF